MRRLTKEEFIDKARLKHGDKYNYDLVYYSTSHKLVKIICDKGHIFEQTPNGHLSGRGCQICAVDKRSSSQTGSLDLFIKRSNLKHVNKYDYKLVEYVNARTKVDIICPKHGVFSQTPDGHLRNSGCSKCGSDKTGFSRKLTTKDFIQKAVEKHGNIYDYSLVDYKKNIIKIKIICPIHNVFE